MPAPEVNSDVRYQERRFAALETATGQTAPSYSGAAPTPTPLLVSLATGVVGASQATIPHGLTYTPKIYGYYMTTLGNIFQSQAPDATNIYLTADSAARQGVFTLGH